MIEKKNEYIFNNTESAHSPDLGLNSMFYMIYPLTLETEGVGAFWTKGVWNAKAEGHISDAIQWVILLLLMSRACEVQSSKRENNCSV